MTKPLKVMRKKVTEEEWVDFGWFKIDEVHSDLFISLSLKREEE